MKVTIHYCDFNNPNVKQHVAQFTVVGDGMPDVPSSQIDACETHLCQMVMDLFRKDHGKVAIIRLEGAILSIPGQKATRVWECSICGKTYQSGSGLRSHRIREAH